ncbi:hypothetical protein DDE82_006341 [Stemphylium lycopersici]|uniref:DNA (cytosine-5)-methyltransferase 1 replication foci domain-containing protein n=1 Tax=Stemphylium lycopersici TaxID=183478 RepID=A0A364MYF6_STELY|nr:hypothetical protein TW65_00304 [Stemphylium lycopersici]RAR01727.1 hypothetical protein DDE82_006341 [Stemphylium lycopersici]RAR07189.1 hypothetical protein DDE83_006562 [Stemphylium lycopersici]
MSVSESEILKPLDASNTNSDDWEIFVLNDARVVYESNGKPASLLAAYADTPLKVEGRLETPARSQLKYLLKKPYKPTDIEIRNVTRFSYGEMTDGAYVMWAQGKAGWFEIRPTAQYKPIYDDMVQAVELLYFVTDIYSEARKKGGGPSADLVFQEYAEDERFPCNDTAMAEKLFDHHHMFLMMCFLNRAQGLSWSNTSLYQRFRRKFPKGFDNCKARIEGRYSEIQLEQPAKSSKTSAPTPASNQTPAPAMSEKAQGKTPGSKTKEVPKKDDNWWEAAALFEFMQKAVNQRAMRAGRNQITLDRVAELVVRRYEIEEMETAKNVLLVHAQNICYMMDHPRRKVIQFFAAEPIYQELAAGHTLSAAEQRRAEGVELKPRRDHATLRDGQSDSSDTSDEEDGDALRTPVRRPPGRRKKGRLSVLRPKSGNFSGKSKSVSIKPGEQRGGKGKAPVPASTSSSTSQSENEASSDSDSEMESTLTQAASPHREKRKLDEADTEHEVNRRQKRTASASLAPSSPPSTNGSDSAEATAVPPLPLRHLPSSSAAATATENNSNSKPIVSPSLISTPLPTYEANGPRDSWLCSFDGCTHRIYGCSKELGRQLITEHLEDHSRGREKVVGILWREQSRLHLPVNNLIKKIREMSEASSPLFRGTEGVGKEVKPVERPV